MSNRLRTVRRKLGHLAKQPWRQWRRVVARKPAGPIVLANSVPKSGTHLLLQVLEALPVDGFGTFLASTPSITLRERHSHTLIKSLRRSPQGELLAGHIFYSEDVQRALEEQAIMHVFIYRDPRDVVVSEAHYLAHMNKWHRLHREFAALRSQEDQLTLAITGVSSRLAARGIEYPDIGARFLRFIPWLPQRDTVAIRYEDMMTESRTQVLRRIGEHYAKKSRLDIDVQTYVNRALANIDPKRSHTFYRGGVGRWREAFSPTHRELFKEIAGALLIDLGYERDLNW